MSIVLAAIIGSAAPSVRTLGAVNFLCSQAQEISPDVVADIIDLRNTPLPMCDGREAASVPEVADVVDRVARANAVVLASPIYRGSVPGALKNLIDWLPVESLEGKNVGLIASAGSPHHYLMIDCALRPILAWFNAATVPGSVFLTSRDISAEGEPNETTARHLRALATALVTNAQIPHFTGPPPLVRQLWQ